MSNQIEAIQPVLIFFLKNEPDHQNVLYFHSSLHCDLITFFILAIKALRCMLAGLNRIVKNSNQFWPQTICPRVPQQFQRVNGRYFSRRIRHPSLYRYSNLVVSFVRQLNRFCSCVSHFVALFPAFLSVTTQKIP